MASLLDRLRPLGMHRISLEITESALLEASSASSAAIAAAKASGAELAIDDFGTGYSALAYVERFPIDTVKIDRRFIARLEADSRLADAILGMTTALGLNPVAEGVETVEQLVWLAGRGCRFVQGFLFAAPLDAASLTDFIDNFRFPIEALESGLASHSRALPRLLSENQEQALRLFVRHVPSSVAMFDTEMRYLVASDRWLTDYGIAGQEVIGRCHYEVLPDTPQVWRDGHARCLKLGVVERSEEDVYCRPDGSREWLRWEVHPFRNRLGDIAGIIIFSEFITARREAERRLAESEARLRDYLATASDWVWEAGPDHRLVSFSGDLARHDIDAGSFLGRTLWQLEGVAEPSMSPRWREHQEVLSAGRPFRQLVLHIGTQDGSGKWIELSGKPVFAPDGGFTGYRGSARDVTATTLAARERQRQTRQLELASELAELGYWRVDYERGKVHWSEGLYRMTGRDPAGTSLDLESRFAIYHPEDRERVRREIAMAVDACREFTISARIIRPDGGVRHIVTRGQPQHIVEREAPVYFGIMQDATDAVEARLALEARGRENELFRAMIDTLPDFIFAKDRAGRFLAANAATAKVMRARTVANLLGRTDAEFYPPDLVARFQADEEILFKGGQTIIVEQPGRRLDGSLGWLCSLKAPLRDVDGTVSAYVGHGRDITEEKLVRQAIQRHKAEAEHARDMLHMATAVLTDGFALYGADDRLVHCNESFASLYGRAWKALLGRSFAELHRMPRIRAGVEAAGLEFNVWLDEQTERHARADGVPYEFWFNDRAFSVREQRTDDGAVALLRAEVTHLKQVEQELRRLATIDTLTGAYNRRYFTDHAERILARSYVDDQPSALLLLDIDHFKQVNDTWGHAAGDEALRQVCQACVRRLRPGDVFARWGGEEFVLLLPWIGADGATCAAERLRAGIAEMRLQSPRARFAVTLSIGIAIARAGEALDDLIRRADRGLYAAKAAGRNRAVMMEPSAVVRLLPPAI
jgi:diguanylate cyclase (GGDEF)-like protein/PAS domain S-box-containing protein